MPVGDADAVGGFDFAFVEDGVVGAAHGGGMVGGEDGLDGGGGSGGGGGGGGEGVPLVLLRRGRGRRRGRARPPPAAAAEVDKRQ